MLLSLVTQHIFEHANPSFRILSLNRGKTTTNGLFVERALTGNIRCMKWELQDEKICEYCEKK
jgi:hypothetical protein